MGLNIYHIIGFVCFIWMAIAIWIGEFELAILLLISAGVWDIAGRD